LPIIGAVSPTLTLTNVQDADAAAYTVVLTNLAGSVTSSPPANLTVICPFIAQQPTNLTAVAGGSATFNVAVLGSGPFNYQWRFNGTNLPATDIVITTVAGNGAKGYGGDGGVATSAELNWPSGVSIDASGNLFIADQYNHRIRKVSAAGIITTVAGNGTGGFGGDGGFATNADLHWPTGVSIDTSGNLFIADQGNNRIRKVSTNGIITTVVGNGTAGYNWDGGAAISAELSSPCGVAVDGIGNLFIADYGNFRIRKVGTNGIITTVAGNGTGGFADGGSATNACIYQPTGVSIDASGNLFIADPSNYRIRKVTIAGIITTVAGNGTGHYGGDGGNATNSNLYQPTGVFIDASGNLFIADCYNHRIRKVSTAGIITTVAGNGTLGYMGDGGTATNAELNYPWGVSVDAGGNLFIADENNNRIRKVTNTLNNPSFILNTISNNNGGSYSVVITDPSGSVTSSVVTLTVVSAIITQQPQSQLAILGSSLAFSVNVSSAASVAYQWYLSSLNTAGATAQMSSGFVYGTTVTNGGAGYTTVPRVQFIGGGGSGAGGAALINNGQVTAITVTNAGSGYTSSPAVLIDSPTGLLLGQTNGTLNLNAITTNNVGGYFVVITNIYGSITSSVATLSIAYPPSISQQPQNQTVSAGSSANFNITAVGTSPFGYQWWMTGGLQSNATAVPVVINGFVLAANMTSGGAGYLAIPSVQFVGGSGTGANGTAVVSNRMVTAINLGSAGSGYTNPPTIQIGPPIAIVLTGQTSSSLSLPTLTNTNAGTYFVVVTNNYGSVTSILASLTVALPGYNQIFGNILNGGKMSLSFVGIAAANYALDESFTLAPANWIPQVTNMSDGNGNLVFTNKVDSSTNGFFRIRSVP
jgi:sugar lactone lactonase YvrE